MRAVSADESRKDCISQLLKKGDDFLSRDAIAACLGLISLHLSSALIKTMLCILRESVKE